MSWRDKRKPPNTRNKPCVKCGGWVTVIYQGKKMIRQCQVCKYEEEE